MKRILSWTAAAALTLTPSCMASCQNPVPPGPTPVTGGSAGTGGTSDTGGATDATGGQATGGTSPVGGSAGTGGEPAPSLEQVVCGHLKQLGCPEGDRPTCPDELWRINHLDGRASIDLDCLLFSDTVEQIEACHSIACGGVK